MISSMGKCAIVLHLVPYGYGFQSSAFAEMFQCLDLKAVATARPSQQWVLQLEVRVK